MRRVDRTRSVLVVVATLLVLALGASPAGAGTRTVNDPADAARPKGDVRSVTVTNGNANVVITLTVQRALNKTNTLPWTSLTSASEINIPIDTGGTAAADYRVDIKPSPGGAFAAVIRLSDLTERCYPFLTQPGGLTQIRVRFEGSCIQAPQHLSAFARYELDIGGNGSVESVDRAPNSGYTAPVPRG